MKVKNPWVMAGATLLAFAALAWLVNALVPVAGAARWVLWIGMILLGLLAAVVVHLLVRRRGEPVAPAALKLEDDVEAAFRAATTRLAGAGLGRAGRIPRLPAVLVLGPAGSTKTTVVAESGLEAELLAGEAYRGGVATPTGAVNVWYTRDGVLVEAAGRVLEEAEGWKRVLRHLRSGGFAAALGRRKQAPRAAVVCYSCEELLRPGASASVPEAARTLRARLADVSRELGIRLPVYVVFTKVDRIPHFEEFVRSLSREEAQELLGATLPVADVPPGGYAEFEASRLQAAFRGMLRSLALRRPQLLSREMQLETRLGAYEFPRELRKLGEVAVQFLVELCRPSQLGTPPFLRGFYFTGVRPIVVSDAAVEAPPPSAASKVSLGATSVFNPQSLRAPAAPTPAPAPGGGRRVPEWVFLRRVLRDLVMRDAVARAITAGGARVNLLRRTMLAGATLACLLLGAVFTVSYVGNRRLVGEALGAARGMEAAAIPVAELPTADALARLDGLRGVGARLAAYDHGERPLRLRWGLYRGRELRTEVRTLYFDRFQRMLWGGARSDLVASLAVLPQTPRETADYGRAYDALKAYLVTTSHPEESTPEFLTPVILEHWRLAPGMDAERGDLARRQFDYYAAELPDGNPYAAEPNTALVQRTRIYLQSFSGVDAFYQALLSEAGRAGKPVQFNRMFPGTEAVVRNAYTVPAAFTAEGWGQAQSMLADVDRLFAREDWVVGERSVSPAERAQLAQQLRQRYTADYVAHWSDFLRAASVVGFDGAADAASKLTALGGNESPLLRMFALASHNTAVDSLAVAPAFQPVQAVVPPQASESFVTDANSQYLAALVGLQTAMDQVAKAAGPERTAALGQAAAGARNVEAQVRTLAQGFHVDHGASETGRIVQRLMLTPVGGSEALVKGIPLAEANDKGRQFCAPFRQLAAAYPFAPGAAREATVEDVNAALQPGASALWSFYQDALTPMIAQQGSRYAARIGAEPPPNPEFVAFFNRAAQISHALYPANATAPRVDFALALQTSDAMPEATFALDGQTQTFTRTMVAARPFSWDGSQSRSARITARVAGASATVAEAAGPWAIFRLLQRAEWQPSGNGQYLLRWPVVGGGTLTGTLTFAGGAPVFSPRYLQGLDCVSRIVR